MKNPPALYQGTQVEKEKHSHSYFCKACIVVGRTPLMVQPSCTELVLHKKKRLKKVTVLNTLNGTCLDSLFRPT